MDYQGSCQTCRKAPATARGAWITRGVVRDVEKHQQQPEALGLPGELSDMWKSNSQRRLVTRGVVRHVEKHQQRPEVLGYQGSCQTCGKAPATARGAWIIREVVRHVEKHQQQPEALGYQGSCQTCGKAPATARGAWLPGELSDMWKKPSNSQRCLVTRGVIRHVEKHQQQPEVLGYQGSYQRCRKLQGEFLAGIMPLSC